MLAKKECKNALDNLYKVADKLVLNHDIFISDYKVLNNLIEEYFAKETPRKPFIRKIKEFDGYNKGRCECDQWLDDCIYNEMNYCPKCGQKIDWSAKNVK